MATVKLSIIVPNYNHASYLSQRIDSILNQTFQDFELILLDDTSTDNSSEIIERYKDHPKVSHIVFNNKNSGSTFRQWEKGMQLAQGKYIWIAESDDFADLSFSEKCVDILENNPSVGLVFCQSVIVDESNNLIRTQANNKVEDSSRILNGRESILKFFILGNHIANASSAVLRKEASLKVSRNFTTYRYSGDWFFYISILLNYNLFYIPEKLNFFRLHSNKVTARAETNGLAVLETYNLYCWIQKKIFLDAKLKRLMRNNIAFKWAGSLFSRKHNFAFSAHLKILVPAIQFDPWVLFRLISKFFGFMASKIWFKIS